jgi:hypothetical protein
MGLFSKSDPEMDSIDQEIKSLKKVLENIQNVKQLLQALKKETIEVLNKTIISEESSKEKYKRHHDDYERESRVDSMRARIILGSLEREATANLMAEGKLIQDINTEFGKLGGISEFEKTINETMSILENKKHQIDFRRRENSDARYDHSM